MTKQERPSEINFGDLVRVDGYGNRPFFVDGWTEETIHMPDEVWSETWYDLVCAHTGEYHMAELADITRICGADQADDYLMYHAEPYEKEVRVMYRKKPEPKPTARELSAKNVKERAANIDKLLDEYNDYRRLADEFGDEEYRARVDYLSVKLSEIVDK